MHAFLDQQETARRNTAVLVALFALAVAGTIACLYPLFWVLFFFADGEEGFFGLTSFFTFSPLMAFATAVIGLLFIGGMSLFKTWEMRRGGAVLARSLGGTLVPGDTDDPQLIQLRNVVEEMAVAAGVPAPDLYVMNGESSINAFAAGFTVDDAVLCVTRGAVGLLERDELQGVVAHEFSHIGNGDMALNLHLIGWLHGILAIDQIGRVLQDNATAKGWYIYVGGAILRIIGSVGHFFGAWIKSALTRQREYLADATAVQFTRNPDGLAGALKKIAGLERGAWILHPNAALASHLFFGNALQPHGVGIMSTHPPLRERILRLDPSFDGTLPEIAPLPEPSPPDPPRRPVPIPRRPALPPAWPAAAITALLARPSAPLQEHLERARQLRDTLPEPLLLASRSPLDARTVVYALLMDPEPAVRQNQETHLAQLDSPETREKTAALAAAVAPLPLDARLALLDLCLPALRALTPDQYTRFRAGVAALADTDPRTSLFEFLLRHLLLRHLDPRFFPKPPRTVQIYGIAGVQAPCALTLSAMARIGHRDEAATQAAFDAGVRILQDPGATYRLLPADQCGPAHLTNALDLLNQASVPVRRRVLAACQECLSHDRAVTQEEAALFRAVAAGVGYPLPAAFTP